jgi:hypothetical protein
MLEVGSQLLCPCCWKNRLISYLLQSCKLLLNTNGGSVVVVVVTIIGEGMGQTTPLNGILI